MTKARTDLAPMTPNRLVCILRSEIRMAQELEAEANDPHDRDHWCGYLQGMRIAFRFARRLDDEVTPEMYREMCENLGLSE